MTEPARRSAFETLNLALRGLDVDAERLLTHDGFMVRDRQTGDLFELDFRELTWDPRGALDRLADRLRLARSRHRWAREYRERRWRRRPRYLANGRWRLGFHG